jgi:hypothetical protein
MSPDPFDVLRDQLVAAAAPAAVRRRRPRGRRPIVVLAAVLALGGSATAAAVLTLGGDPSPPLRGHVPGGGPIKDYTLAIAPSLRAGEAGWCTTFQLRGRRDVVGGGGCGPALEGDEPQIAGGGVTAGPTRILQYLVVDRRVALVRLADGRRIVPRADPGLPFGWRVVVAFTATTRGRVSPADAAATLLGADGRALPRLRSPRGVPALPTTKVDPHAPPARPCAIAHAPLAHLRSHDQTIVRGGLARAVDVSGRAFRTCSTALFSLDGVRLRAAVLVDAAGPGHAPAALPRSYVPARAVARREADAWLVVDGGTAPLRRRLLAALTFRHPSR